MAYKWRLAVGICLLAICRADDHNEEQLVRRLHVDVDARVQHADAASDGDDGRDQGANIACPAGFTGQYCDIVLCDDKGTNHPPHPDLGFPIDIRYYPKTCEDTVDLPVDSHVQVLFLFIDGVDYTAHPAAQLLNSKGVPVKWDKVITMDDKTLVVGYIAPTNGIYTVNFKANTPCMYQAHAQTDVTISLGSVSGDRALHNDFPRPFVPEYELSYLVAHPNNLPRPGFLRVMEVFRNGQLLQAYRPSRRFACEYELYFGPFMCMQEHMYHYKMIGVDMNGFRFERTDSLYCARSNATTTSTTSATTTTTTEHSTTTALGGCLHDGLYDPVSGVCVCTPFWYGKHCENIVCFNGGTPAGEECKCPPGYGDKHCFEAMCAAKYPAVIDAYNKSMVFVVQNTASMKNAIAQLQEYTVELIEQFQQHHQSWIKQYVLVVFDDSNVNVMSITSDPYFFMEAVHHILINEEPQNCSKMAAEAVAQAHLYYATASYSSLFVLTDSPDQRNASSQLDAFVAVANHRTTVNVFVSQPECANYSDAGFGFYRDIASFSGGQVYYIEDAWHEFELIHTVPTAFMDNSLQYATYKDCTPSGSLYVPIDSHATAFTVSVAGSRPHVAITDPDGNPSNSITLIDTMAARTEKVITPCPKGWQQHGDQCLMGSFTPLTWLDAQATCHNQGAVLVSILNKAKQQFMTAEAKGHDYWTGLNDIVSWGDFYWDSLSRPFPLGHWYLNWGEGQPDTEQHTKNCMYVQHVNSSMEHAAWFMDDCEAKHIFVCQRHAFDAEGDRLKPGLWKIDFGTSATQLDDYWGKSCELRVHAQSDLQVYYGFSTSPFSDVPLPEPESGHDKNYVIANVSETRFLGLEYVNFFDLRTWEFIDSKKAQARNKDTCYFNTYTEPFACPSAAFGMHFVGQDDKGYAFHRLRTGVCIGVPPPFTTTTTSSGTTTSHFETTTGTGTTTTGGSTTSGTTTTGGSTTTGTTTTGGETTTGTTTTGGSTTTITTSTGGTTTTTSEYTTMTTTRVTGCKLDVVFVIDSSQSITSDKFGAMKNFVVDFIDSVAIGPGDVQVGGIVFNDKLWYRWALDEYTDAASLKNWVKQLSYYVGLTNTALGLEGAAAVLLGSGGHRPDSSRAVVLFSDGWHDAGFDPSRMAAQIRQALGAHIAGVGFPGVNGHLRPTQEKELVSITGSKSDVFVLKSTHHLQPVVDDVISVLPCFTTATTTSHTTPTTTAPPKCYGDVTFVVETSERVATLVGPMIEMVSTLCDELNVQPSATHAALVHYSAPDGRTGVLFDLDDTNDMLFIRQTLMDTDWEDYIGNSDIDLGLKHAEGDVFTQSRGDRPEAPNFTILIGSGFYDQAQNCCPEPFVTAEKLRRKSTIYAVEVGAGVHSNLVNITHYPDRVYTASQYHAVAQRILQDIREAAAPC